mmetsp:Transcript_18381/g.58707  ORF Transcript_18381/g.58707 Transcript_18381/m.58707 type:complete len:275 (-) Transcript_18381:1192-2016(-)
MARPVHRVAELRVRTPRGRILALDDVGEDVLEPDRRDALPHPDGVHLLRRVRPHLGVVRRHEGLCERLAKAGVQPLLEVARLGRRRARLLLSEVLDDAHHLVARKPPEVGLHRVADPRVSHPRRRVALVVEPLFGREHLVEQRVEKLKVGEEAVDADVPREAVLVADGAGEPRRLLGRLDQFPVGVAELGQPVGGAQSGRAGADDCDPRVVAELRRVVVVLGEGGPGVLERVHRRRRVGRVVVLEPPVPAVPHHRLDVGVARLPADLRLDLGRV